MTNVRSISLARQSTRSRGRVLAAVHDEERTRALQRLLMLQALAVAAAVTLALSGLAYWL